MIFLCNLNQMEDTMTKNKLQFPNLIPFINTERLILKQAKASDAVDMHTYLSDKCVRRYMGIHPYESIQETKKEIKWYENIFKEQTGIRWGISLKDDPKIIGSCGFLNISKANMRAEIGYELHREFWGKGLMSEALAAILQFGFKDMNINRIEALVEPENIASLKLLENFHFVKEGLLRQYEYGMGKYDDLYMYSLLNEEFIRSE